MHKGVSDANVSWGAVRSIIPLALLLVGALASPSLASAQAAPFCIAGESPHFAFGFADLKVAIGDTMGDPTECEHPNSDNGDTLQQTTAGLAIYRKSANTPEFTDGFNHWALEPAGVVAWSGGADAAPVAPVASAPAPVASAPAPWGDVGPQAPPVVAQKPRPSSSAPVPPPPARPRTQPTDNPPPPASATQCVDLGGGMCVNATPDLAETITLVNHSATASGFLKTAARGGYVIHYGDLPTDVLGLFRPGPHDVVMSNVLKDFPALDRAPVLAHEVTHVSDWTANSALLQTSQGCLSTEVHAFHTESATWLELAGSQTKPSNDLEREYSMISKALATDPKGFTNQLAVAYHSQCAG
jgi:hypothetical protein